MLRAAALLLCLAAPANAETALVAVAANFAEAALELANTYSVQSGHEVRVTTGATGKLYAQISEGAPFDLLLAADTATPAKLAETLGQTPFTYAIGKLVLWAPAGSQEPKETLLAPATRHVAIANPDLAPYGVAAREALENMGLWNVLQPKIVMGQNVGQAFALVASGAAEAGFVAASARLPDTPGLVWPVPADLHTPIRQDAILLAKGQTNAAAIGFLAYLQTPLAQKIIENFGYGVPE